MAVISRHLSFALSVLVFLSTQARAQQGLNPDAYYRRPSSLLGKTVVIPVGTTFEGRIDSQISSCRSTAGQAFTITMSSPVLANGTEVLIPAGSQITGEVVEAISSNRQHHEPGQLRPRGKLRVQINGLRTPDGQSYPLVASIVGEVSGSGRQQRSADGLGGGIAYVGSSASFDAVAPGAANRYRNRGQGPQVVTRDQLMHDPIYGQDSQARNQDQSRIRSLVERGRELYIDEGSPLSIRLNAPFKMSITSPSPTGAEPRPQMLEGGGRRFSSTSPQPAEDSAPPQTPAATPAPMPQPPPKRVEPPDNSF